MIKCPSCGFKHFDLNRETCAHCKCSLKEPAATYHPPSVRLDLYREMDPDGKSVAEIVSYMKTSGRHSQ